MKKGFILGFAALLSLFISACASGSNQVYNNDWSYILPNDYEIWHVNARKIVCGKKEGEFALGPHVAGDYITEFCYNNQFVCLKCVVPPEDITVPINLENPDYYIIDTVTDTTYGPLCEATFLEKIRKITDLSDWESTTPHPNGAVYGTNKNRYGPP